jgi:hypothetical protein
MTKTRLIAARAAELRFEARMRPEAPLLLCPLFALLGALPWLSPGLDPVRLAVSIACVGLSVALAVRYHGRRWSIVVRPEERALEMLGRTQRIASPPRITLDVCHDDTEAPRGCYVASIALAEGGSVALLVSAQPDVLLRALRRVLEHLPAQVECRWELPAGAEPWVFEPIADDAAAPPAEQAVLLQERVSPRALIRVIAMATALVLLDLTVLITSQQPRLPRVHPLSLMLPLIMGSFLLGLTGVLATRRVRLTVGSWIESDVGALGLHSRRRGAPVERVRGVHVVGAETADGRHILLDTSDGPIAVWVPQSVADTKAREIWRAVEQRRRGRSANLGSITSAPHTSPGA